MAQLHAAAAAVSLDLYRDAVQNVRCSKNQSQQPKIALAMLLCLVQKARAASTAEIHSASLKAKGQPQAVSSVATSCSSSSQLLVDNPSSRGWHLSPSVPRCTGWPPVGVRQPVWCQKARRRRQSRLEAQPTKKLFVFTKPQRCRQRQRVANLIQRCPVRVDVGVKESIISLVL